MQRTLESVLAKLSSRDERRQSHAGRSSVSDNDHGRIMVGDSVSEPFAASSSFRLNSAVSSSTLFKQSGHIP